VGNAAGATAGFTSEKLRAADAIFGSGNVDVLFPVTQAARLLNYGNQGVVPGAGAVVVGEPNLVGLAPLTGGSGGNGGGLSIANLATNPNVGGLGIVANGDGPALDKLENIAGKTASQVDLAADITPPAGGTTGSSPRYGQLGGKIGPPQPTPNYAQPKVPLAGPTDNYIYGLRMLNESASAFALRDLHHFQSSKASYLAQLETQAEALQQNLAAAWAQFRSATTVSESNAAIVSMSAARKGLNQLQAQAQAIETQENKLWLASIKAISSEPELKDVTVPEDEVAQMTSNARVLLVLRLAEAQLGPEYKETFESLFTAKNIAIMTAAMGVVIGLNFTPVGPALDTVAIGLVGVQGAWAVADILRQLSLASEAVNNRQINDYAKDIASDFVSFSINAALTAGGWGAGKAIGAGAKAWRANQAARVAEDAIKVTDELVDAAKNGRPPVSETPGEAGRSARKYLNILQDTCFIGGTPVLTPMGEKAIEDFKPGDEILSRPDDSPDAPAHVSVVDKIFKLSGPTIDIRVGGQTVTTTYKHPFFVPQKGWTLAVELQPGDLVLGMDGESTAVESVEYTNRDEAVYNVRVASDHTYFVGRRSWGFALWVHNLTCAQIEDFAAKFAAEAQANGGNVPRGVWDEIGGGNLSELDKSTIRQFIRANPDKFPNVNIKPRGTDGPLGSSSVRTLDGKIGAYLKDEGWTVTNGGGAKQEWIAGGGPGRTGGTAPDLKATRIVNGNLETVRIQTIDTLADGITPTAAEAAAAARIRAAFPNQKLILIPKGAPESVWKALLSGL
jgi:hypothetical protein